MSGKPIRRDTREAIPHHGSDRTRDVAVTNDEITEAARSGPDREDDAEIDGSKVGVVRLPRTTA
jgi:hypothetical protein